MLKQASSIFLASSISASCIEQPHNDHPWVDTHTSRQAPHARKQSSPAKKVATAH